MVRQDGTRPDSLYYSVLAEEWPSPRDKLLTRVMAKAAGCWRPAGAAHVS
ncbi:hypothetical protein [Streptomyces sp. NPDC058457]